MRSEAADVSLQHHHPHYQYNQSTRQYQFPNNLREYNHQHHKSLESFSPMLPGISQLGLGLGAKGVNENSPRPTGNYNNNHARTGHSLPAPTTHRRQHSPPQPPPPPLIPSWYYTNSLVTPTEIPQWNISSPRQREGNLATFPATTTIAGTSPATMPGAGPTDRYHLQQQ